MAEHTLAVTFEAQGEPPRSLVVDREAYEAEAVVRPVAGDGSQRVLEIVSCGKPFAGHEVAIVGAAGELLGADIVGEIVLRGPSVTSGYFENEEATRDLFLGAWMRTGDLGFIHDGRLYVSGRLKDLIIVNGKKYHPQDLERVIEEIPGLRRAGVVVFGIRQDDTERVVVVAEAKSNVSSLLRAAVEVRLSAATGFSPFDVVFVRPNVLPKTSSGKAQRLKTRALYLHDALQDEAKRARDATAETARGRPAPSTARADS
jgi:fatty-acyl-CoA synthase